MDRVNLVGSFSSNYLISVGVILSKLISECYLICRFYDLEILV